MTERRACKGGATRSVRTCEHMEECVACETRVRSDLVDHWFFGFAATCDGRARIRLEVDGEFEEEDEPCRS